MRIKWNRHLDGSSSRRQEDDAENPETDEKKVASSTPGIFKIFRRKKSPKDASKSDGNHCVVAPPTLHPEAPEDDSASISSVATCASQPTNEAFQRDRSSSLFSSFRLSLPGSRRKKRKVAPEAVFLSNGQQNNEPQVDRYSTPDLRKPSDKLGATTANGQVNLSNSSPSIRNPKGGTSTSAQSLEVSESLDKLRWPNPKSSIAASSSTKLSKSVSFSDCKDGLTDYQHSSKTPRAVNCTAMVEEDSAALENELSACLSSNPGKNRESEFTAVGDSASSGAHVTGLVGMTKAEEVTDRDSKQTAVIGDILNDISTEIQSYKKVRDTGRISSVEASEVNSLSHCNPVNAGDLVVDKNNRYQVPVVDFENRSSVQCIDSVPDTASLVGTRDSVYKDTTLHPVKNANSTLASVIPDDNDVSLNTKLRVLSSELTVLTTAKNVSPPNCDTTNNGDVACDEVSEDFKKFDYEMSEKQSVIPSDKHVVCHIKFYENEPSTRNSFSNSKLVNNDASFISENLTVKNSLIHDGVLQKESFVCQSETERDDINIIISAPCSKSCLNSENLDSLAKPDLLSDTESSVLEQCSESNKINCDQKVPGGNEFHAYESRHFQNDQQVPEFELSLREFEEVCSRYMSCSTPEFSDCNSTIPLYNNSPKRKSVFDLSFSLTCPNLRETGEVCFRRQNGASPTASVQQNPKLQSSCQNLTERHSLPSPPKQWNNYENAIDIQSHRDVCTDGVQCTKARGKYLCQEPCLEALPTTVMLDGSDLRGIDTPQLSSTLGAFETKSGRKQLDSIVTGEKGELCDSLTSEDMISNVGVTVSTLDYPYVSESSGKCSIFLDSEIRETYRGPRAICDPLIYSAETTKGLESLGPENYLNGHNLSDMRSVGFREVISDDYVPAVRNGLIEISNPYEDSFILPQDLPKQKLTNNGGVSLQKERLNSKVSVSTVKNEISKSLLDAVSDVCNSAEDKVKGTEHGKLTHVEQKNFKNKNSMIPCRSKKVTPNNEKHDPKLSKSARGSNSVRKQNKTDSHLPVKNNISSRRVFSISCKDSVAEQYHRRGKLKDLPPDKPNGNCAGNSPADWEAVGEISSNSQRKNLTTFEDYGRYVVGDNKTSTDCSDDVINLERSFVADLNDAVVQKNELDDSKSAISWTSVDNVASTGDLETEESKDFGSSSKCVETPDSISECEVSLSGNSDARLVEDICPKCTYNGVAIISSEHVKYRYCSKHSDYNIQCSRRSSLSAAGMLKTSYTSSVESLSSQLTSSSNRGKSRIPRKQTGPRAQPASKGPVRPPMWLSKAELTQEIQRLGTLCEARTKELNRLKMETKHVTVGFDAFAALFKYMVEDLNGLSVPDLTADLGKTLKQLELTKQDLAYYEREVEEMKSHHCQELNDLSNKLFEVYQSEVAELNAKHQEEINHLKNDHQKQMEHLTATYDSSSSEAKAHHEKMIAGLEQEIINQREELQQFQEREIKDLEEKHAEGSKLLQEHIEQLQKKCAELKQHSMSMEDAMRKDTDSKLQWVTGAKLDLEKEVESLKAVLEMKNKELHTLRVQNLEMEKQMEELPFAREKIKMLQARAEDLEALMAEKTKLERKLSTENQQMRDTYEKEAKVNRRLSMENEELQWRLRQAENSLISGSFSEVPEFPEAEETVVSSPIKSPGPQLLNRSVFFTFVDKDESTPHSPRSQYKKISPNFSANYKTSPAKSSKSPPAPSPRRGKSHSEPPHPLTISTPRKVAKKSSKCPQKRQRSGSSDSPRPSEQTEVQFSSLTGSMASSVCSESSVFEHRDRLLDEHKEHIVKSLEILRERRNSAGTVMEKKWCSDDIKVTGELSRLETEDMSRSAEFSDPKTYYHMTFPVLKESGIVDDIAIDDTGKNSSSGNSPMKEVVDSMHSMSENGVHTTVEEGEASLQVTSEAGVVEVVVEGSKRDSCTESTLSAENVQKGAGDKSENRWRTI